MSSNSGWPETSTESTPLTVPPQISLPGESGENPPWTGWDVLRIAALTLAMIFAFVLLVTIGAEKLLYPKLSIIDVAKMPMISVVAQLGAYLVVLGFMYAVATRHGKTFGEAVSWNWPGWSALAYLGAGVAFSVGLQGLAHVLPMPKSLPIDKFFQTPAQAWVLTIFGVTLAPLLEELFFRGFLYPVLARRLGTVFAVILTASGFALIHEAQLGRAWGPVLIVFLIGLTLTIIRAVTKSVAAGVLTHVAYNGTISVLVFIVSGGFRHLERITQ
jgi:membrane protease YdiL (CAAX protease family)